MIIKASNSKNSMNFNIKRHFYQDHNEYLRRKCNHHIDMEHPTRALYFLLRIPTEQRNAHIQKFREKFDVEKLKMDSLLYLIPGLFAFYSLAFSISPILDLRNCPPAFKPGNKIEIAQYLLLLLVAIVVASIMMAYNHFMKKAEKAIKDGS